MIYRNWGIYKHYLEWVRSKLRDQYLDQLKRGEKPLFIHINRTGGTSIAKGLDISPIHFSLSEYEHYWQRRYKTPMPSKTVFTSVRNPYHRAVSQYFFRIKSGQNGMQKHPIAFDDWLYEVHHKQNPKYRDRELMFQPQYAWLESETQHNIQLIRFENLAADYLKLLAAFEPKPLPWERPSSRPDYETVLTPENKALLARVYATDFEHFNYPV
jgi:hypothetical protein